MSPAMYSTMCVFYKLGRCTKPHKCNYSEIDNDGTKRCKLNGMIGKYRRGEYGTLDGNDDDIINTYGKTRLY